jgi:hypothetical protein
MIERAAHRRTAPGGGMSARPKLQFNVLTHEATAVGDARRFLAVVWLNDARSIFMPIFGATHT